MCTTRYPLVLIGLLGLIVVTAVAPTQAAEGPAAIKDQQALIDILLSADSPKADKALTCKRLAIYGDCEAVPALAPLLEDEQLASWARIALEAIPDVQAGDALREALDKVEGRLLTGVINSIGVRRDAASVEAVAVRLTNADAQVAEAAAIALGCVGDAAATRALQQALADTSGRVRSGVAAGLVLCAERLLDFGDADAAAALYEEIRAADVPKQRIVEATRGLILARGADGIPLLIEQLQSPDKVMFNLGLQTARELPGGDVTEALVGQLGNGTPHRQAMLITTLAARNDPAALPSLLKAAQSGPMDVRIAAVGVLGLVGDVSSATTLLDVALESDEALSQAAKAAVEGLPGDDVDADLAGRLSRSDGAMRQLLIELAGQRRIAAATPALLKAADDSDAAVRAAALTALGETVGPDDLAFLIARVVSPKNADDTESAKAALGTACVRMPDGEGAAAQLAAAMDGASLASQVAVLDILGAMGGATALETLRVAGTDDSELQDAASRLLGGWMTMAAAPVLLELAQAPECEYRVRAMRGYIRLVRQFPAPDAQRVRMCVDALNAAERDAEKKLVLEVMARYPSIVMLRLAVDVAKDPALKDAAAAVSLAIAQKISGNSADVQALLAQIGQDPVEIEIIKAEYGSGTTWRDVTEAIQKNVGDFPLIVLPGTFNKTLGGDPTPGVVKQLKIQYTIDGAAGQVSLGENAPIMLPTPK